MTTTTAWTEAEDALRALIRQLAAIDHHLRIGTTGLHWRGPAADSFATRTRRRHTELEQQQQNLRYLVSLVRAAATTQPHATAPHATAQPHATTGGGR